MKEKKYAEIENTEVSVNKESINMENLEEDLSEIFKAGENKDYHKITEKLLNLTYSEDGFERDFAVTAIGMLKKNIPKDMVRKVIKRLLEISDPYVGHHLPEVIGDLSDIVPDDLREETMKFLFSLLKNEKTYMCINISRIVSGKVEMRTETIDDTEYMHISAASALLKFRGKIPENLSRNLFDSIISSSDLKIEKNQIEFIKSIKHSISDEVKNEMADKLISMVKAQNLKNKIKGLTIISEILIIFPDVVIKNLANSVLESLKSKNTSIKSASMDAFEKIYSIIDEETRSKFIEELINESSNKDWTIRLHVAKTLGEIKDYISSDIRDQIIGNLIKDKEWPVKVQALNTLSQIFKS